jgi:hypothetical protein
MSSDDIVLKSFLETARIKGVNLPEDLLVKIYKIEKEHQFTDKSDRGVVNREIEKVVQQHISSLAK